MEEHNDNNQLSKKQLRRQEKLSERDRQRASRSAMNTAKNIAWIVGAIVVVGGIGWLLTSGSPSDSAIITTRGLHWHPHLAIRIHGEAVTIPGALGGGHGQIHTHDTSGTIHMEFSGAVNEDMIRLSRIFKVWGAQFNRECILEFCNGENGTVAMSVNGVSNDDFGDYTIQDGDEIQITFE